MVWMFNDEWTSRHRSMRQQHVLTLLCGVLSLHLLSQTAYLMRELCENGLRAAHVVTPHPEEDGTCSWQTRLPCIFCGLRGRCGDPWWCSEVQRAIGRSGSAFWWVRGHGECILECRIGNWLIRIHVFTRGGCGTGAVRQLCWLCGSDVALRCGGERETVRHTYHRDRDRVRSRCTLGGWRRSTTVTCSRRSRARWTGGRYVFWSNKITNSFIRVVLCISDTVCHLLFNSKFVFLCLVQL